MVLPDYPGSTNLHYLPHQRKVYLYFQKARHQKQYCDSHIDCPLVFLFSTPILLEKTEQIQRSKYDTLWKQAGKVKNTSPASLSYKKE